MGDTWPVRYTSHRRPHLTSTLLHGLAEILLTVGVVVLLFVGYQTLWTDQETQHTQRKLQREFPTQDHKTEKPDSGDPLAVLRMPRLGADWKFVAVEGTGIDELKRGPGHIRYTALPGEIGNFAVAGHRVTYARPFWNLNRAREGDKIYVTTPTTRLTYRVSEKQVVSPRDTDAVAPVPGHPNMRPTKRLLTFVTCHPRYSARERLVVHAELIEEKER